MNAQNLDNKPVIKRESKNKIRVEFDRTPLKERLKAKFLSTFFLKNIVLWVFRLVLMIGISYIVLNPFLTKIAASFMAPEDFSDATVRLIPKHFTLDIYRAVIGELGYFTAFKNTFLLSFITAILQTFVCCLIGYGFAKFKFRGRNLLFGLVVLTMVIPHQTIRNAMHDSFANFDILGIIGFCKGGGIDLFGFNLKDVIPTLGNINILPDQIRFGEYLDGAVVKHSVDMAITQNGIDVTNTFIPFIVLSLGALAFKNGLYIFLLRQFFRGVPDELEESAYMDGSGVFKTFFRIILPLSIPMMVTVFLFAFCWQWTDIFYTNLFYLEVRTNTFFLSWNFIDIPSSLKLSSGAVSLYNTAIRNTCGLMIILPLVILYCFGQKFLVQGIEQSGLAN